MLSLLLGSDTSVIVERPLLLVLYFLFIAFNIAGLILLLLFGVDMLLLPVIAPIIFEGLSPNNLKFNK